MHIINVIEASRSVGSHFLSPTLLYLAHLVEQNFSLLHLIALHFIEPNPHRLLRFNSIERSNVLSTSLDSHSIISFFSMAKERARESKFETFNISHPAPLHSHLQAITLHALSLSRSVSSFLPYISSKNDF